MERGIKMKPIFSPPIPYGEEALRVELAITNRQGEHNDQSLAELLNVEPRTIRTIIERLNTNKYVGIDNNHVYRKVNKYYEIIDYSHPKRKEIARTELINAKAHNKRAYEIVNKLGEVNLLNMSIEELMEVE